MSRPRPRYPTPEAKLAAHLEPTEDGHARWTGPLNGAGVRLRQGGRSHRARDVAFRAHWGRDPVGAVYPGCGVAWCLAGAHLDDERARQALRALGPVPNSI